MEKCTLYVGWRLYDAENVPDFSSQAVEKVEESPTTEENDNSSTIKVKCLLYNHQSQVSFCRKNMISSHVKMTCYSIFAQEKITVMVTY